MPMASKAAIEHLRTQLAGDVLDDTASRQIHAADASLYEQDPTVVVRPRTREDVSTAVRWAAAHQLPITARGAGTSLAGQATGGGMILDLSRYFTTSGTPTQHPNSGITSVTVEPGVIRDDLNDALAPTGLFFAPETATSNRCTIGGMIANNSCGTHSPAYGTTRDHVLSIDCILADGSSATFTDLDAQQFQHKLSLATLEGQIYREIDAVMREHRDAIVAAFPGPEVTRRNTGYALDRLAGMQPWNPDGEPCNLAPLICGSEGTLVIVVNATLALTERPRHRLLIGAHFDSVIDACQAAVVAVEHHCSAGELIDGTIIAAARNNREQARRAQWIAGNPGAVLAIEMEDTDPEQVRTRTAALVKTLQERKLGTHHPILEASEIDQVWAMRNAGLGLLMGIPEARKAIAMIEDAAVAPRDLPAYVAALDAIMQRHAVDIVYYAHAAAGELHPRPKLDLRDPNDVAKFENISREVAETVKQFGGSLSGEHGDGRVRAPFIELMYGHDIVALFERIKYAFDPQSIFNPHKIIAPLSQTTDLRTHPDTPQPNLPTAFDWSAARGLVAATEACNGAGVCRKSAGRGTMCPSYHATHEERYTTRGRANLFRRLLTSPAPGAAFTDHDLHQALSLCLSCKACASECPANVDMARLKAEFTHQRHQRLGISKADQRFGRFAATARRAQIAPRFASWIANRSLVKRFLGIDPRRSMPAFAPATASQLISNVIRPISDPVGDLVLIIDEFSEFLEPQIALDAISVLQAGGWQVHPIIADLGRSQLSRGLLDEARQCFEHLLDQLAPHLDAQHAIVGLEPSAVLGLYDEAPDLVSPSHRKGAQLARMLTHTFEQFVTSHHELHRWQFKAATQPILVHGHCHQKALTSTHATLAALRLIPDAKVTEIASGCCGMAGSFGYEHYELSMQIGNQILFPAVQAADTSTLICAPGTSCRHQIHDGAARTALHPASILATHLITHS